VTCSCPRVRVSACPASCSSQVLARARNRIAKTAPDSFRTQGRASERASLGKRKRTSLGKRKSTFRRQVSWARKWAVKGRAQVQANRRTWRSRSVGLGKGKQEARKAQLSSRPGPLSKSQRGKTWTVTHLRSILSAATLLITRPSAPCCPSSSPGAGSGFRV
jgi:hypothetical protein